MRSRLLIIWIICSVLAIWTLSYETFQFQMVQFSLPSITDTTTDKVLVDELRFPPGINYTTFVTIYSSRRSANNNTNIMISENSTSTTDSPLLDYFPDFCGDWWVYAFCFIFETYLLACCFNIYMWTNISSNTNVHYFSNTTIPSTYYVQQLGR